MKKKIIFSFIAVLLLTAFLFLGCTMSMNNEKDESIVNQGTPDIIVVDPSGETLKLGLQGLDSLLSETRAPTTWVGTIAITGAGITGTYTTYFTRSNLDNGGFLTIKLPLGIKSFTAEINCDGGTAIYQGSQTANIVAGNNIINISLVRINSGYGIITINMRETFTISLRAVTSSFPIPNATIRLLSGSTEVGSFVTGADGQVTADVLVQAISATPYTYQITHNTYVTISGTIKVLINSIILDGTATDVMHLSKNMVWDTIPPVITLPDYPTDPESGYPLSYYTLRHDTYTDYFDELFFNVADNCTVSTVTCDRGTVRHVSGSTYAFKPTVFSLGEGDDFTRMIGATIYASDVAGNNSSASFTYYGLEYSSAPE